MPIGHRVRTLREALRMSQEDLAVHLRALNPHMFKTWDYTYIRRIEHGTRSLKLSEAQFFARALRCTLEDLADPID